MTNPDTRALQALADKVEAGERDSRYDEPSAETGLQDWTLVIDRVMCNSDMNAAKSLHEALVPSMGWEACERARYANLMPSRWNGRYLASVGWGNTHRASLDCPAQSWFLAILRALIAGGRDGQA